MLRAMWNSFRTDARDGLTAEVITYSGGGGDEIHAYVARPGDGDPGPGVVAVHHLPGWDEFYREFSDRLARHGYTVICPDLYDRFGHGTPDDVAAKVRSEGGVNGKAGIIGTCSGGRHALLAASRVPGFAAVADLWGGGVIAAPEELSPARPVAVIDYTADLAAPLLGLFGNDDRHPSPEQVDRHEAELKRHGKDYEFHRYDGASHAFFYYHTPMYRPEAAMDGWAKVFDFFSRHLSS